jgi:hypothetical protein
MWFCTSFICLFIYLFMCISFIYFIRQSVSFVFDLLVITNELLDLDMQFYM